MELYSTQKKAPKATFKQALFRGLPPDNGLYMPETVPQLSEDFFKLIGDFSFQEIALEVSKHLLEQEIPAKDLKVIIEEAINFDAPLVEVEPDVFALELFHGPTLAFKDFGARFMARVMGYFLHQQDQEIHILVATSGDTGSAVANGFLDVPGIRVTILYPKDKVSKIQEMQLTTLGGNITALEIEGTFDDCQKLVKEAFLDKELSQRLHLTSANSINISRLIPQSFYYFYAYAQLPQDGRPVVFSVPSGNFGNLCGGLLAKKMGLPVHRFIASTNINKVFPDYLATGTYQPQPSIPTIANAMDVGDPSNFVRVQALYDQSIDKIRHIMKSYYFTDEELRQAIKQVFSAQGYLMCPHSAAGYLGLKAYQKAAEAPHHGIFLCTAHPAKFLDVVEGATNEKIPIPKPLQSAMEKTKLSMPMDNNFDHFKAYLLG